MDQVTSRMKQMSALLTLLFAVLLTGPLPGTDASRQLATALVKLDVAQGVASLNSKQPARDTTSQDAPDDSDSGDPAILPALASSTHGRSGRTARRASVRTSTPETPRPFQARAPPAV